MRSLLFLLAVSGLATANAREAAWHLASAPGRGCWPARCEHGQIPLATPIVAHGGRLLMIGDGAAPNHVYESSNGVDWVGHQHDASWGVRYQVADASYRGAIWRVGGFVESRGDRTLVNDVWRSTDGRQWQRVTSHAPWPARARPHLVVFHDTLWLIGGEPNDGVAWLTTDGRVWIPRTTTSLPRDNPQGVLAFHDSMWAIGFGQWERATNEVWVSATGSRWTRVARPDWPARTGAGVAVLAARMWVVGGVGHRDAWYSADGRRWHRAAIDIPGPPRSASYSVVFDDKFWVFGGKTGGAGGTGFWDGVAYR